MLLVFHCCGYTWAKVRRAFIEPLVLLWFFIVMVIPGHNLGNSQVSVNRTIGPTLVMAEESRAEGSQ